MRSISRLLLLIGLLLTTSAALAQNRLALPSELYVLTNEGRIERYGLGSVGARSVSPTDLYIIDFGLDALGERIAYRTEQGIIVAGLSGGEGIQLEGASAGLPPYRGSGDTIAWSPTGDALAYTTLDGARVYMEGGGTPIFTNLTDGTFQNLSWSPAGTYLAAQTPENVWWIYRRDEDTLSLASIIDSSVGTAWVSNNEIVFAPLNGGLKLMNLNAANAQAVLLDENDTYRLPYLTTSDQLVFFGRPRNADYDEGYGLLLRLSRGAPQVETIGQNPVPLSGLQWAPGGTIMTLLQGGALALFDPVSGNGSPMAVNNVVAFDWAPLHIIPTPMPPTAIIPTATPTLPPPTPEPTLSPLGFNIETVPGLTLSEAGFFLAPLGDITQVWQLPANGQNAYRFTGSEADVTEFVAAPNNSGVAYVVDGELWFQPFASSRPIMIAALNGFAPITPSFSPDATRVAYTDETANGGGIWIAYLDGTPARRVLPNTPDSEGDNARRYRRPQFSPDGTRLLVDAYAPEVTIATIFEIESGDIVEIPPEDNDPRIITSRWLPDGRILMWRDGAMTAPEIDTGLYIFDSVLPDVTPVEWVPLPTDAQVRDVRQITPGQYRTLLSSVNDALIRVVDVRGFDAQSIAAIDNLQAPRLSSDSRFVAGYETLTDEDGDGIAEGPLIIADLERGGVFRIAQPPAIWNFRWVGS